MTTHLWAKICGLSTREAITAAVQVGADAVGFVMAPGGPRTIDPDDAAALVATVPESIETVGVFRRQSADEVVDMARRSGVATVQLHGDEPPETFDRVRAAGFGLIRAVAAERYLAESPTDREPYGDVRILLDAPEPGAGATFDTSTILTATLPEGWILAGGLTPANVRSLAASLRPGGVDVSSGVERSRGVKDPVLIRAFLDEVRALDPAPRPGRQRP